MASGASKPSLPDGARSAAPGKQPAAESNVSGKSGGAGISEAKNLSHLPVPEKGYHWRLTENGYIYVRNPGSYSRPQKRFVDGGFQEVPRTRTTKEYIHKNDSRYKGDVHVYAVTEADGTILKYGETARSFNSQGELIRVEEQIKKLTIEKPDAIYLSEIVDTLPSKKTARKLETTLIREYRKKNGAQTLPLNKGER